ncbi:deleted in malignant brain tumors 1 protein-like [Pristis pectinata]|uniref:deleted in malignant brain tumors 1 protein-like n=1 Tax=Pristis pectinata TaxID=685728 RepID=UPI00223DB6D5|nr:deleted in malignant brain tumors 1 protein-like [Pristis pectinata]
MTVCGVGSWALSSLDFVCKELNCGSAVEAPLNAHFGEGSGPVIGPPGCSHQQDIGVICSESRDLRLVSVDSRCSGRLEIRQRQQWGTVCDSYFDLEDAAVVCSHLRCGTVAAIPGRAQFGKGTGPVWNQKYMCRGYESRLWDCPISPWDRFSCSHESDVSVICSEKNWVPRLTNGGSRCDGRVEIYYNRSWGRVQDNLWDINDANVTCRELGCGYAISVYSSSKYGESEGPVWVNEVTCQGNESQLQMCNSLTLNPFLDDSDGVGVLCSEHLQLRLTGGGSPCAGRVEVYYGGAWGSVCDDSWDLADAQVVCRQLGCGNALETKLSGRCGQISDRIWLDELSCSGYESFLWQCPSAPWGEHDCSHKEDAMAMCSEHKELQLVNGKHRCEGRVEVFYNGSWGTVCSESLDDVDAEIICKQLQCGPVQSILYDARTFGEGSGNIWLEGVACDSHELTLWQCRSDPWGEHNCNHKEDAGVVCSGQQLRLVGRNSSCSGRVEILSNNSWGTVCDDSWDLADANVVCRQLGCGSALSAAGRAAFDQGDGVIWLDEVKCTGSESFLSDCGSSPPGQHDCDHKEDAGVICSESVQLRLANGGSQCAGRVEIHYNGTWGTVHDFLWDLPDAAVVCRELGCGVALAAPPGAHFEEGSGPFVTGYVKCGGNETALRNCESYPWGHYPLTHSNDAGVICAEANWRCPGVGVRRVLGAVSAPCPAPSVFADQINLENAAKRGTKLRLVNGNSPCAGRLEVYENRTWRTICSDESWALAAADIVCKELGCGSGAVVQMDAHFGEGTGPVIGPPGCGHQRDLGVICSETRDLRLVSVDSRCSGRLEIRQRQQWGTVCDRYFDLEDAAVVCAHLRCGTVVAIPGRAQFGKGTGPKTAPPVEHRRLSPGLERSPHKFLKWNLNPEQSGSDSECMQG